MRIGLISDTHGHLDEKVFHYFNECDEIWHIGDIGNEEVLDKLENFKPTIAVYGNIDGHDLRSRTKKFLLLEKEGLQFLITHIAGKPPTYNPQVRKYIGMYQPGVLICGHSHFLKVQKDDRNKLLFLNPGAAGIHGFHKVKTLLRFDVEKGKIFNLEVVELGKRSRI